MHRSVYTLFTETVVEVVDFLPILVASSEEKKPTSSATVKFERKRQKLNHVVTACKRRGPPVPEIWKHTRKPSKLVGSNKVTCKARLSFSGASWEVAINFST